MNEQWNVTCDGYVDGKQHYLLGQNVPSRDEAEKHTAKYRLKYEGRAYPNGKGVYPFKNFRAVKLA